MLRINTIMILTLLVVATIEGPVYFFRPMVLAVES